jgi:hypothetical protein
MFLRDFQAVLGRLPFLASASEKQRQEVKARLDELADLLQELHDLRRGSRVSRLD